MTRQSVCHSQVDAFAGNDHHQLPVQADYLLIYALDSDLLIKPPESDLIQLAAGQLLEVGKATDGIWEIDGAAFIAIQINLD